MADELGNHAPKYIRIADALRRDIEDGTYEPGKRLPSETELLDRFREQLGTLSLPTLRQAISVLRSEGLVTSQQGIGTFVQSQNPDDSTPSAEYVAITERLTELGAQIQDVSDRMTELEKLVHHERQSPN